MVGTANNTAGDQGKDDKRASDREHDAIFGKEKIDDSPWSQHTIVERARRTGRQRETMKRVTALAQTTPRLLKAKSPSIR